MKRIKGVEITESQGLSFNLQKLRNELNEKYSFWYAFDQGMNKIKISKDIKRVNFVVKTLFFIGLFPQFVQSILDKAKVQRIIREAEDELKHFYSLPETKIRTFRLQCEQEELRYRAEVKILNEELQQHEENMKIDFIGEKTKNEINELMVQFRSKLEKKNALLRFYEDCRNRLLSIEKQIEVRKQIETSKKRIDEMDIVKSEVDKKNEMENEFKIFDYYGDILEELNTQFKKVEEDEDEKIEDLELKEIITQIDRMNLQ